MGAWQEEVDGSEIIYFSISTLKELTLNKQTEISIVTSFVHQNMVI